MELHGMSLIAGETSGEGSQTFYGIDPALNRRLEPPFFEAGMDLVDAAGEAAREAFEGVGRLSGAMKAEFLEVAAEEILGLGDELLQRAQAETGLPQARLAGERGRTVSQLRMFAALVKEGSWVEARIDRAQPHREPLPKPDLRRMLVPIGPVAVFGASNFPLAFSVAGGDAASAFAAGNPVVVKGHPAHPGTSELVGRALATAVQKAGLPPGFFSLIQGVSTEIGLGLVSHPAIKAVGFTGSLSGGRALFNAAARRPDPIPVFAEMGSINPVFLLPEALQERGDSIAEGLIASVTLGAGQFCTNPGLVVVVKCPAIERFKSRLAEVALAVPAATMLHAGIRSAFGAGVAKLSGKESVSTLAEGRDRGSLERNQAGVSVFSTDAVTFLKDAELSQEVFGPSTLLVICEDREEMIAVAADLEGHLTATVHGSKAELEDSIALLSRLENRVGRLVFNGFPTGVEVCPSMHHGGPYPATTDVRSTSVGTAAIQRFARPVCFQDCPQALLPFELKDGNPAGIWRLMDGSWTQSKD